MKLLVFVIIVFLLFGLSACGCIYTPYEYDRQYTSSPHIVRYSPVINRGVRYYKVRKGDTLYSIALRAELDYKQVAKWNYLKPPFTIFSGQNLRMKSPYVIKNKEKKINKHQNSKSVSEPDYDTARKKLKIIWQWPLKGMVERAFALPDQKGVDIVAYKRHSILAAASGKVVYSGSGLIGYGNLLIIKHSKHFLSAYGNNSRLLVKEGSIVKRGQQIAEISPIGGRKAFLHFEIRKNGKPVNPQHFLPES